jgi:hypothetical protein
MCKLTFLIWTGFAVVSGLPYGEGQNSDGWGKWERCRLATCFTLPEPLCGEPPTKADNVLSIHLRAMSQKYFTKLAKMPKPRAVLRT